ncbi:MAG: hypothetical protein Q8L64_01650 [bacterium]|nr:hypothetical protein [bacterium]
MKGSLFGHLALNFSASPENLATEAFCFILNRSEAAKMAFVRFVSQVNPSLPLTLRFETQIHTPGNSSEENTNVTSDSRPDFAGRDDANTPVMLGEVKFWAGLTDNQPVTYLKKYPESSVLMFVAPSKRLPLLWNELIRRCKDAGLGFRSTQAEDDEFKSVNFDKEPILLLTSWRKVLNAIRNAVEADGDADILSDILQLEGLCNRMDQDAFLPIRSEELTSDTAKRILQYCELVDDITDALVNSGVASTKGLQKTSWSGVTGRYMTIHSHGCFLHFNSRLWRDFGGTPIWFQIQKAGTGKNWSFASEAKTKLIKLELEEPSRLLHIENRLYVPLFIPMGVEKSDIIKSLLKQLQEVIDILSTINA